MKKVLSVLLIIVLMLSLMPFSGGVVAAQTEEERIISQIKATYTAAKKLSGMSSFDGWCARYVRYQLLALDIISNSDTDIKGNGNKMYGNATSGTTSKGYTKIKYAGNDCIRNIVSDNGGENVYNIFVSWTHQYGYSASSPGAGHATFIHAIINGTVYYSESYTSSGIAEGAPRSCSVSSFYSKYNKSYGNAIGAVHFVAQNQVVTPSISLNKSSISLGTINNTSATLKVTCNGPWDSIGWNHSSVYNISKTAQDGNVLTFKVSAKAPGTDTLKFQLYNEKEQVVATKSVSVTVTGPQISSSAASVSLNLTGTNTSTVTLTVGGDLPANYYVNAHYPNNIGLTFGSFSGGKVTMTLTGKTSGSGTITCTLIDSSNGATVATTQIAVTVYAPSYTVTYNANGGTGAPSSQTKEHNKDLTLSSSKPTGKTYTVTFNGNGGTVATDSQTYSYTFDKWNTKSDGSGTNYWTSGNYSANENATLYAQWYVPTLKVENPTRSNYYFAGWYDSTATNSAGLPTGKKYTKGTPITSNITLYAMWSTNVDLTVFFGDYNLDGVISAFDISGISLIALDKVKYTDEDLFRCDVNADGKVTAEDSELLLEARKGTISMYAMPAYVYYDSISVKQNPYKTTYAYGEPFDCTGLVLQANYLNGTKHTLSNGYIVTGYDPYKIGTQRLTVNYYFDSTVLYVTVEAPRYTLYYDANGGEVASGGKTVVYGNTIGTLPTPTREGYTFLGWSYSLSGSNYVTSSTTYSYMSNKTLYAQWSKNEYTVTYDANGGKNVPGAQKVIHGNAYVVDSSTIPYRTGYTFLGWSPLKTAATAAFLPEDQMVVSESLTLYAVWEEAKSLSLDELMDGTVCFSGQEVVFQFRAAQAGAYSFFVNGDEDSWIYVSHNDALSIYPNSLAGQTFIELAANELCYVQISASHTTKHFSVGVEKQLVEYVLEFKDTLNGTSETFVFFEDEELSLPVYEKEGYVFLGWATSSTATIPTYSVDDVYIVDGDAVLYAVWSKDTYTLSYSGNGGPNSPGNQTGAKSYTISSTVPTRFGYTFLGWSKSSSATTATYEPGDSITLTANTTLYAVWKAAASIFDYNLYTASVGFANQEWYYIYTPTESSDYVFESRGSVDSMVYVYDAAGNELDSDNDGGNEGNNFRLRISLSAGTKYYIKVRGYSTKTGDIKFSFRAVSYTITYSANGGLNAPDSQGKTHDVTLTLSSDIPTRSGYTFLGWSTSSTATSATYQPGGSFTINDHTKLYAVWKANTYTVSYNANGGSEAPSSQTKTHDVTLPLSSAVPTRNGYTFLGWSTSSTATSATYQPGGSFTTNADTTLYAVWKCNHTYSTACDATCNTCGATRTPSAHVYSNNCDTTCNVCGATRSITHDYAPATCTNPKTCRVCGMTTGSALGHSWNDATCTAPKTCSTCGTTFGSALGHNYTGKVTKQPTCTAAGVKTYTCSVCNHSYTESIEALEHNWEDATCTAPKTCSACGTTSGNALGHSYTSKVTKQPTCTTAGVKTYTCSACAHSYTESIAVLGHTWKDATCTTPKTCATCGATSGNALGHDYTGEITAQPTCTAAGVQTYTCSVCNHSYTESVEALGHDWEDATCTAPKTCSACGATSGNALGHNYTGEVTTQPTCTAAGVQTYTCSTCAHSYTEALPTTGEHSYSSDSDIDCNTCGAIREIMVVLPGDATGDGKVNNRDLGLLQQYLNEWEVTINFVSCDINEDGKINNRDLGLLQRYLND